MGRVGPASKDRNKQDRMDRELKAKKLMDEDTVRRGFKLAGELLEFRSGLFRSKEKRRWVELDPSLGTLSVWSGKPPPGYQFDPDTDLPRSDLWQLCGSQMISPLSVYKMFELEDVDINRPFRNIFAKFKSPDKTLVLTALTAGDFETWSDAMSAFVKQSEAKPK
eukprot:gb/GFBE01061628.1/.p1 GENE.gb/GFBE01061628.1/~~gb/GFBE01061628.1/.p1  ORF type:complete len:165 (+),score=38.84 gb/GFBE01061628.1/:1-495(+)